MPDGQVLEFSGVTKRFGAVTAVSGLSARVEPGVVTGFLGPNGAGKTTSLRILLGLVRASTGEATIGGVPYSKLKHPLQSVGAVLEASSFHPGRTAANHLKVYAQAAGLPNSRVDEALATVGLTEVAGRKVGGYSLGMRQRLGLAYALLGDPGVLVLDEPSNGLDPEGIVWMRGLLRQLARQGRTVLVSSHMLAEVQQTVDALLIISQGRLVFQGGLDALSDPSDYAVVVDSPDRAALSAALKAADVDFEVLRSGLTVRQAEPAAVGAIAAGAGVALSSLQRRGPALEEVFLDLVNGVRVHESATEAAGAAALGAVDDGTPSDAAASDAAAPDAAAPDAAAPDPSDSDAAASDAAAAGYAVPPGEAADAEEDGGPGAAVAVGAAVAAGAIAHEDADDDGAAAVADGESAEAPAADLPAEHAAFAVATTGVIEAIPDAEPEAGSEDGGEAEAEASDSDDGTWTTSDAEPSEETTGEDPTADGDDGTWTEPAPEDGGDAEAHGGEDESTDEDASHGAWAMPAAAAAAVADDSEDDESAGYDAAGEPDADVATDDAEALTEESGTGDREPVEGDADYVKTEADIEADRFFASFTAEEAAAAAAAEADAGSPEGDTGDGETEASEPEGDAEPWSAPAADAPADAESEAAAPGEPEPESETVAEPEGGPEAENQPEPEPAASPEAESPSGDEDPSEPAADADPEPAADADPEPEAEVEPAPEPEAEAAAEPEQQPAGEPDGPSPSEETTENDENFGSWGDLAPEWGERDSDTGHESEGGEQR